MSDSVSLVETNKKENTKSERKDDSFIPVIIESIKRINIFKIILLFILFLIINSTTFIENILYKFPGCTEQVSTTTQVATNTGVVAMAIIFILLYIIIGLAYDYVCDN